MGKGIHERKVIFFMVMFIFSMGSLKHLLFIYDSLKNVLSLFIMRFSKYIFIHVLVFKISLNGYLKFEIFT